MPSSLPPLVNLSNKLKQSVLNSAESLASARYLFMVVYAELFKIISVS